jgi:hypothetical protein
MRGNQLDQLEQRREEKKKAPGDVEAAGDSYVKDVMEKIGDLASRLAEILGITAGIIFSPFVVIGSFFKELAVMTKRLDALMKGGLSRFFSPIINFFNRIANSKLIQGLVKIWTKSIVPFFRNIGKLFGLLDKFGKAKGAFSKILNTAAIVGRALARFSGVLTVLIGAFEFITGFVEGFNRGGFIEGLKQGIIDVFDALFGFFIRLVPKISGFLLKSIGLKNFGGALSNFGDTLTNSIIGVFGSAVDLIVGLFTLDFAKIESASLAGGNAVINFIAGVADVIYGLIKDLFSFAGITLPDLDFGEIIRNTLTSLEDIIKNTVTSAVNFVKKKLGFDQISDMLGELSFSELLRSAVDTIWGLFTGAKDWIVEKITGFSIGDTIGNIADAGKNFLKDILRSVLPDPSEGNAILKFAKRAIPDDLYKFAGLDPKTGEEIELPEEDKIQVGSGSSPSRVAAGDELQMESESQRDAEREALGRVGGPGSNAVSVSTNVQNNSNTTTQTRPSASSQPDNMSDTMLVLAGP